jgi:hypothetical protein
MPSTENGNGSCATVMSKVEKRKRIVAEAKKDQVSVIVEACLKVDKVGDDVAEIKRDVKKIRHSVHGIRDLVYTLHPEANPDRSFMDRVIDNKIQIVGLLITFFGAVVTTIGLFRFGII